MLNQKKLFKLLDKSEDQKNNRRTPPEVYGRDYFLSDSLEGYQEFKDGNLSVRQKKLFELLEIKPGLRVLDIGFGRGDLLYYCAKQGAIISGIDYSKDAVAVANEFLTGFPGVDIREADCKSLPFPDNCFDRVVAGDVIEHLNRQDALLMLKEAKRVLRPGGFLLIHTAPNTIFTKIVYPLVKPVLKIISGETVGVVESHFKLMKEHHIYEYNIFSLRKAADKAGLAGSKIWLDSDLLRSGKHRFTQKLANNFLVRLVNAGRRFSLVKFFFSNDLFLKYYK